MSVGLALFALLGADPGVSAIAGSGANARIYPVTLKQAGTLPAVTYFEVSAQRVHASPQGPLKLAESRIQIDTWAGTYAEAVALAEAIRKCLDGYAGTVSYGEGSPQSSLVIKSIFIAGSREFYESEPKQYRVSRDFMIWFEEAID